MVEPEGAPGTGFDFDTDGENESLPRRLVTGLTKLNLATRHRAWQEASGENLTPTQGQVLALLRLRQERGLRLSEIATALAVTPATASEAVRTLVTKSLLRKERAADDGRAIVITLTDEGHRAAERAAGWSDFLIDAADAMTEEEQAIFLRGLVTMIRSLQERGDIPISRMCVTCQFFQPNRHPDSSRPHHCGFVDAPFGDRHLRLECVDHQPAPPALAEHTWQTFRSRDT